MAVKASKETDCKWRGRIGKGSGDMTGGIDGRVIIKCRWHKNSGGIIT